MTKLFADIKGQEGAVAILSAQLKSGNLSHAYIFLGEEGTGKEYLAREFARCVLCDNLEEKSDCPSCQKFKKYVHSDFTHVDGKEGIKIEMVRGAVEKINLSPFLSKKKVLLMTNAENLGIEAANALLKTLEEPPKNSIIILTAITEKSLPETIISRGQKIKMTKISEKDIREILSKEFSAEEVEKVIEFSEGNIGEAKALLTDSAKMKDKKKVYDDVEAIFTSKSIIEKMMILEGYEKAKKLNLFFDAFSKRLFLDIAKGINEGDSGVIKKQKMAKKVLKIYEDLDYNVNLRLALEEIILTTVFQN